MSPVPADPRRLDALIQAHSPRIYRIALGLAGSHADAEDITQEALLALVRGIDSFRGESQLSTWVYRLTLRAGLRWLARNRRPEQSAPIDPELPAAIDRPALELLQLILRLPLDSRTVLLLVAVEGLSHSEAAEVLDIPEGTVASRLHHARARLRESLART
jgi:RNA polymerase sigma-70 factor (ECF subfamily)